MKFLPPPGKEAKSSKSTISPTRQTTLLGFFQKRAPKTNSSDLKKATTADIIANVKQQQKLKLESKQTKRPLSNASKPPKKKKAKPASAWTLMQAKAEVEKWKQPERKFDWEILDSHPQLLDDENIHDQENEATKEFKEIQKQLKKMEKNSRYIGVGPFHEAQVWHKGKYIGLGRFPTEEDAAWAVDMKGAEMHGFYRKFNMFHQEKSPNFLGVSFCEEKSVYACKIYEDGRWVSKGEFEKPEEAARKFDEEWVKIVGPEAALLNFPPEKKTLTTFLHRKQHSPIPVKDHRPRFLNNSPMKKSKPKQKLKKQQKQPIDLTQEDEPKKTKNSKKLTPMSRPMTKESFPTPPRNAVVAPAAVSIRPPPLSIPPLERPGKNLGAPEMASPVYTQSGMLAKPTQRLFEPIDLTDDTPAPPKIPSANNHKLFILLDTIPSDNIRGAAHTDAADASASSTDSTSTSSKDLIHGLLG